MVESREFDLSNIELTTHDVHLKNGYLDVPELKLKFMSSSGL